MAKHIKIIDIANKTLDYFGEFKILAAKNSSSEKFDNSIATSIQEFLPLVITKTIGIWNATKNNQKTLSGSTISNIKEIESFLLEELKNGYDENIPDNIKKNTNNIVSKITGWDELTISELLKNKDFVFNSKSQTHDAAFGKSRTSQNIIIRLKISNIRFRIGIDIIPGKENKKDVFIIKDIVNKKTGN